MNTDRDKYLTEAMGGKIEAGCLLDVSSEEDATLCVIDDPLYSANDCCFSEAGETKETCGEWKEFIVGGISDFSTWYGFGNLWEWAQEQEWCKQFEQQYFFIEKDGATHVKVGHYINPDLFANAVYEFLKGREA